MPFLRSLPQHYRNVGQIADHHFGPPEGPVPAETDPSKPAVVVRGPLPPKQPRWLCHRRDNAFVGVPMRLVGLTTQSSCFPHRKPPPLPQTKSVDSFKILTECPVILMVLCRQRAIDSSMAQLLPLMVEAIALRGPSPDLLPAHLRAAFADLKGAQIKTLSFLTYMVKDYSQHIYPHQARICEAVVDLLRSCPDVPASRRELIAATRHIVASPDFRASFFPHLDTLLEKDILIGTGRACYETQRPHAYHLLVRFFQALYTPCITRPPAL